MNKKRTNIFLLSFLVALFLFFLIEKNFLPGLSPKQPKDLKLLETAIDLIKNHYVEEPNPTQTMEGAFKGLVDSLDVLSSYLDEESALKYQNQRTKQLMETGIILYKHYGSFPQVIGIIKDSPAEKAEIQIGDLVSSIDNTSTLSMSMIEANLKLKHREKGEVKLKILSRRKTQHMILERKVLFEGPVSYSRWKEKGGLLKIHHLYPPCLSQIQKLIPQIREQNQALVLDLRNCYEGQLEQALSVTNLFLQAKNIGYIQKKGEEKEILSLPEKPSLEKLPLIVWVNQATLGPAEAAAAILKESKRAKIIGKTTPGLAARQTFFPLEDGSALVLNSGLFHLKSGKTLWKNGLTPDVKIKRDDHSDESYLKQTQTLLSRI
ncbi:MAG: S41 family peptidase [Candidatus Aminicenantes bacterium]